MRDRITTSDGVPSPESLIPTRSTSPRPTNFSHMRVGSASTGVLLPRMSLLKSDYGGRLLTSGGLPLPLADPPTPHSFPKSLFSQSRLWRIPPHFRWIPTPWQSSYSPPIREEPHYFGWTQKSLISPSGELSQLAIRVSHTVTRICLAQLMRVIHLTIQASKHRPGLAKRGFHGLESVSIQAPALHTPYWRMLGNSGMHAGCQGVLHSVQAPYGASEILEVIHVGSKRLGILGVTERHMHTLMIGARNDSVRGVTMGHTESSLGLMSHARQSDEQ